MSDHDSGGAIARRKPQTSSVQVIDSSLAELIRDGNAQRIRLNDLRLQLRANIDALRQSARGDRHDP